MCNECFKLGKLIWNKNIIIFNVKEKRCKLQEPLYQPGTITDWAEGLYFSSIPTEPRVMAPLP